MFVPHAMQQHEWKQKKPKASCYLPVHCLVAALKGMAANSLVRRSTFFAYVTRQKDGSAKNLGLVSTAEVLVHMRMHYLVMESIFVHCCICSSNLSFSKYCCICSLGLVQRSGQVYMVIFVNPSRVGGSLPVKSTSLNPCSSYSASLASNTQMYSIFEQTTITACTQWMHSLRLGARTTENLSRTCCWLE